MLPVSRPFSVLLCLLLLLLLQLSLARIFERCELANLLQKQYGLPAVQVANLVCIARNGSADHGLFQISDLYWCTHGEGVGGKGCHIECDRLLDSDITDDVRCIRTIHEEHTRISGDGFTAWTVYNGHCRDRSKAEIASCFESKELEKEPVRPVKPAGNELVRKPKPKGKIYNRCELAQELYYKHKLPMQEIPTWVCIAQHESSYNTAAVGRLNADGSEDHGLFQISDLYWCTHDEGGGKACHIECDRLLDSDISDDVQCIRTIHEEHTRLSGDGFNAWTVYNGHCRGQSLAQLSDCFAGNEISEAEKPSHYGERPQVQAPQQQPVVKIAANHDYGANPFLQRLSASQTTQVAVPAVKTTAKPPVQITVVPNHPFGSNPFLQQIKPQQQTPLSTSETRPIKFIEQEHVSKSSYDHNPFLKPLYKPSANAIQSITQNKPTSHSNHSPAHVPNPFLSLANKPDVSPAKISTTSKPTAAAKVTHHPYISSDSFRQEVIKFTATSPHDLRQSTQGTNTTPAPKTTPITTKATTTHKTTTRPTTTSRPFTTVRPFAINKPPNTSKMTTRASITRTPTTTPLLISTTRRTTTTAIQTTPNHTTKAQSTILTRQTTTRSTTRQTTTKSSTRQTTTRPTTRATTARPTTRYTTTRVPTGPTTRIPTSPTTRPSTRPTTRTTTKTTARFTTLSTTARSTSRFTTARPTTRPTTRATTQPTTTRSTTRFTSTGPTTRPTTRATTQQTTRSTMRSTTTRQTTRPTTRPTTRATTQPTTTRSTTRSTTTRQTTRPTTRPTTRATEQPTTTRSTTRSTTTWGPFTSTWFSTTRYPITTTTARPSLKTSTTFKATTRLTTTARPTTTRWPQFSTSRLSTSTTPRPYLFTSTTTTRRPATTARSATTKDPFDHPFFAKFKATFDRTSPSTVTKPTAKSTLSNPGKFTASPYYAKFKENSVKASAKTAYAYDFGQNRTTTTIRS